MRLARRALEALAGAVIFAMPVTVSAQITVRVDELQADLGEVEPHAAGYLHRASGYVFPRALGDVPARKSTTYGAGDADVYYTLYGGGNGDGWINLFVYPSKIALTEEVANVTRSIVENASGRRTTTPTEMGQLPAGVQEGWFSGSIQGVEVVTGYRVSRVGDWFIKARISIPAKADEATLGRLGAALNAIDFSPENLESTNSEKAKEPVA